MILKNQNWDTLVRALVHIYCKVYETMTFLITNQRKVSPPPPAPFNIEYIFLKLPPLILNIYFLNVAGKVTNIVECI